eukprot:544985-Hanusia_phi.AAC.1
MQYSLARCCCMGGSCLGQGVDVMPRKRKEPTIAGFYIRTEHFHKEMRVKETSDIGFLAASNQRM